MDMGSNNTLDHFVPSFTRCDKNAGNATTGFMNKRQLKTASAFVLRSISPLLQHCSLRSLRHFFTGINVKCILTLITELE